MAEINGIAHIQLSVSDLSKSIPFYRTLLTSMGLTLVNDNSSGICGVGGEAGGVGGAAGGRLQPPSRTRGARIGGIGS